VRLNDLLGDASEQLVLAVEAAVRSVRPVCRPLTLVRHHLHQRNADEARNLVRGATLGGGQGGRHAHDRDHAARPEERPRQGEQHGGVHATGERHTEPADDLQLCTYPVDQGVINPERGVLRHGPALPRVFGWVK